MKKIIISLCMFGFVSLFMTSPVNAVSLYGETVTTEVIGIVETTQNTLEQTAQKQTTIPVKAQEIVKKKTAIKSAEITSKKSIKIIWKKIAKADGYYIYRQQKNGKYKRIKKIKNGKQNFYEDKKLTYGKTYRYYVKAYKTVEKQKYFSKYNAKGFAKDLKVKGRYKKGYKYYYDLDNNRIKNVEPFLGVNPVYCLKVNLTQSVMTVYAKDGSKGYIIPVKSYLCSGNTWDTTGTFSLGVKYRFRTLYYGCYSQWASRIHDDILFHTVPYTRSMDSNSLDTKQYNLLGTPASHGCIRLQCVAVKWINDNCPSGTKVIMYKSDNQGPLGKPRLEKIPSWHTWDPTDPTMQYKCKKKGCVHKIY